MRLKLREIRKERGLNQSRIGEAMDLPQSRVSDIEAGKRAIRLSEAVKVARFLGVKVDDLVE